MGLIRELLLKLESLSSPRGIRHIDPHNPAVSVEGYSVDQIDYHLDLLREAGFISCPGTPPPLTGIMFHRLTWRGHEFLDTVRNPEVWRETKSGVSKIGGASAEFVWEIAKGYVKHLAKEKLGIDVS